MNWTTFFEGVDDYRVQGRCLHRLPDMLMLILCGLLADCEDFEEIHDWASDRIDWLRTFLELPNGIPSHDTLDRLMRQLDSTQLSAALSQWGRALVAQLEYYQLCVDGKELRGTIAAGHKHASVQILSAWVYEVNVSVNQLRISEKTNEIETSPKLLEVLDLQGAIVTADALNCQVKTAQTILDQGGDYLLCLKANQGELYHQVADQFAKRRPVLQTDTSHDKGHGRMERRRVFVDEDLRWLDAGERWPGFRSVVMVERERLNEAESRPTIEFYISSLSGKSPQRLGELIRNHWSVENQLHRHLDVTFGEDENRVVCDSGPQNLSILRTLSLQLLKRMSDKLSLKRRRKRAARDNDYLTQIIALI
jgi:predicted transposase YbfD/YdcC